jgi:hypothetical protein
MKRLRILFAATALLLLQTAASAADRPMSGVHYAFALGLKTGEERNPGVWGVALSPSQQGMVGEPVASPQTELDVARLDVLQAAVEFCPGGTVGLSRTPQLATCHSNPDKT